METETEPMIKIKTCNLVCADGRIIEIPISICMMSGLIKEMVNIEEEGETIENIPLPNVRYEMLSKAIEYLKYHENYPAIPIERPLKTTKINDLISAWDASFINLEHTVLFELIMTANYLDIKGLLELTCAKIASMIKDKSAVDIRKTFDVKESFTPDEITRIQTENKWCVETA